MKKIEDYIHLYIGCDVQWTRSDGAKLISKLTLSDAGWLKRIDDVKLLLRPLSSITDEECLEFAMIIGGADHLSKETQIIQVRQLLTERLHRQTNISGHDWILAAKYFLSKGFDLFGLIDANLALDATKIEKV